jgi:hypothetical protein
LTSQNLIAAAGASAPAALDELLQRPDALVRQNPQVGVGVEREAIGVCQIAEIFGHVILPQARWRRVVSEVPCSRYAAVERMNE